LPPGGDEGFLRQVFALVQTAGGTVSQRTDEGLVAGHNLSKGVPIAGQAFTNQVGVVGDGKGRHFCHHNTAYVRKETLEVTEYIAFIFWRDRPGGEPSHPTLAEIWTYPAEELADQLS
jgi:hypothetical protein